jgi:6-pyruvoyltetrahydropterin/6-carboxytetrahydropterin synthase
MFKIKVTSSFSSAHHLREYQGKCESLHGHNWRVEAVIASNVLDKSGMVIDFGIVKNYLRDILGGLDHKYLNEIEYFKTANPSSEEISRFIYNELKKRITTAGAKVDSVCVYETDTSCATYSE